MEIFSPSLLILEPEEHLRLILKKKLIAQGFNVYTASNSDDAIEILKNNDIISLVSETAFPGEIDNISNFLQKIEELQLRPHIVVLVTSNNDFIIEDAFEKEIDACFYKPFEQVTLEELLKSGVLPIIMNYHYRKFTRIETNLPIHIVNNTLKQSLDGFIHNIAQGGMFVILKEIKNLPEAENIVSFQIFQENKPPVKGQGIVTWVNKGSLKKNEDEIGFGIKFIVEKDGNRDLFLLVNELKTVRMGRENIKETK